MTIRFKTYKEFSKQIIVAHRESGGVLITWRKTVLINCYVKPWNTPATRKSFLVRLYVTNVLCHGELPAKISRTPGYELLGARLTTKSGRQVCVSATEVAHTQTGEVDQRLLLYDPILHTFKKKLLSEVKLCHQE